MVHTVDELQYQAQGQFRVTQQGNVLVSYYKWFTPAAYLASGRPIFDGYLAECFVNTNPQDPLPGSGYGFVQAPINQTEPLTNPLPADDEQLGWVPEITAQEMCAEMVATDLKAAKRHALLKQHGLSLPVSLEN